MKEYTHIGQRRFWSGKYDTVCGLTLPADVDTRSSFSGTQCPKCRKIAKRGKR